MPLAEYMVGLIMGRKIRENFPPDPGRDRIFPPAGLFSCFGLWYRNKGLQAAMAQLARRQCPDHFFQGVS
jgi:hypothetical protein